MPADDASARRAARRLRAERGPGRGDLPAVAGGPGLGGRELAGLLRRLQAPAPAARPATAKRRRPDSGHACAGGSQSRGAPEAKARSRSRRRRQRELRRPKADAAAGRRRARSSRTWRPAWRCPPPRRPGSSRPGCWRSTGGWPTTTWSGSSGRARSASPTSSAGPSCRALQRMPVMNSSYAVADGKPGVIRHPHVNLGLAVDVAKSDGSHSLLVPNIKERRHPRLRRLLRRLRGPHPPGPRPARSAPTTSPARPSR